MMYGSPTRILRLLAAAALLLAGCPLRPSGHTTPADLDIAHYQAYLTEIEYPQVAAPECEQTLATAPPITIDDQAPLGEWPLSLQEAVRIGLANSQVLRDLGGLVLQSPGGVVTTQDPMIQETDPRFGVDAALSAFDAAFETSAFFEKNDRPLNNLLFFDDRAFKQDLAVLQSELSKRAATGTELSLRHNVDYDFNNTPGNPLPSVWQTNVEAEFRHPLMQGAGVDFNRIAGPDSTPGIYAGVLIARVNTDIALADFELGVRNLVADIETQYWELNFAYRDLDARLDARDRALETWRRIHALFETGRLGGEAEKEAQAREQYFRLQAEVQDALTGRQFQKSRTIAFAFRGNNGVHANERELRLLMGVPISDGRLIRPIDEPNFAKVVFPWGEALQESLVRRVELRRQRWQIERSEMELAASRNFLLPRLDVIGRYRWRGLGGDLINSERQPDRFDNAYQSLTSGDYQEWQMGVEMDLPVGFRQAHSAVRNAELVVARQHAVLREQERDVTHDLASALAEMKRAYAVAQTNYNRRLAGEQQLAALEAIYEDADENQKGRLLDLLLDAQRRLADAESRYFRALAEHTMAVSQVHFQKGSLLEYNRVYLSEGPWPAKAHADAARRASRRATPAKIYDYVITDSATVSTGPYLQNTPICTAPHPDVHAFPPVVLPDVKYETD
jgi:hypothetical protein